MKSRTELFDIHDSAVRQRLQKQKDKFLIPDAFPNPLVKEAFLHPEVDHSTEPFQWGQPDVEALQLFLFDKACIGALYAVCGYRSCVNVAIWQLPMLPTLLRHQMECMQPRTCVGPHEWGRLANGTWVSWRGWFHGEGGFQHNQSCNAATQGC